MHFSTSDLRIRLISSVADVDTFALFLPFLIFFPLPDRHVRHSLDVRRDRRENVQRRSRGPGEICGA